MSERKCCTHDMIWENRITHDIGVIRQGMIAAWVSYSSCYWISWFFVLFCFPQSTSLEQSQSSTSGCPSSFKVSTIRRCIFMFCSWDQFSSLVLLLELALSGTKFARWLMLAFVAEWRVIPFDSDCHGNADDESPRNKAKGWQSIVRRRWKQSEKRVDVCGSSLIPADVINHLDQKQCKTESVICSLQARDQHWRTSGQELKGRYMGKRCFLAQAVAQA